MKKNGIIHTIKVLKTLYMTDRNAFFCPVLHHTNTVNVMMVTFPLYWWRKTSSAPPCIISAINEPSMS
jgi:hypothetical protein